ncbi:peptidoglycan/xylan/chitin deacetylase (PgdA/CDA1 family) [Paenibacillus endophyticus]|uniref:Peptidoglycan/xylan/chitin deacetylase (PgdA/CDA1 family) n=1 Tax=Paenibacillus endophyticus TaxID=1294268 RepID=A0A7W5GC30_9BACL|nr:polysaccharide deacetylase family protein [Paenibacillus endophyticus]MBB3154420.1 peptidoglycan/xylan/chitin deacetylase (PgdA/CDA1 family) [Paenibacillus endophyticus]
MKHNHLIICLIFVSLLLSSCTSSSTNENTAVSSEASKTEFPSSAAASPAPAASAPTASPDPTPELKETADVTKPDFLYRMSEAYRFVPIEANTPDKVVLLTFDDGPKDLDVLTSLLDTLDQHNAKAIFFVNGYRVKQNPDLLTIIHERGQTIGNHSWDHINLKEEKQDVVEKQLNDVQTAVQALIGTKPIFFRPPYGSGSDLVKKIAKDHGMLYMTWSNGSLDWDKSAKDKPEVVIKNVMDQLHPGANILMHELKWTAEGLDELLTKLENKGYGFIDPSSIKLNP